MEPYMPGRSRLFPSRYSASPSTTPTPPPTNGFSSPGSSPSNTVSRTIPTTIQINRPYVNNLNNGNLATTSSATSVNNPTLTTTVPISKRPTNSSLSSLGIGTVNVPTPGEVQSNLKELKRAMTDIDNLSTSSSSQFLSSTSTSMTESRSFRNSNSAKQLSLNTMPSMPFLKRNDTSPGVMTITEPSSSSTSPSIQFGTGESVDVDEVLELDGNGSYSNGSGPTPIITSPDVDFSDSESNGLTSPNLVSSMNPLSSLSVANSPASAVSAAAATISAKLASSTSSFEARKISSSSTKTKSVFSSESEKVAGRLTDFEAGGAIDMKRIAGQSLFKSSNETMQESSTSTLTTMAATSAATAAAIAGAAGSVTAAAAKVQSFRSENSQHSSSSQRQTLSSNGSFTHESHRHEESHSSKKVSVSKGMVFRTKSLLSNSQLDQTMKTKMSMEELEKSFLRFDDLENLTPTTNIQNVETALYKYCSVIHNTVEAMKRDMDAESLCGWMTRVNNMMTKAWRVPAFGHEIGNTLCDIIRKNGGMDILIDNCIASHKALQFNSAKLLQQCLITENRGYVVEKGLEKVVDVAKKYADDVRNVDHTRVGTGILEHLFKHSEMTCGDVIAMGGLDTVISECKSTDVETLRHCASALANVAMYGGAENQEAMIKRKVPSWLFPLAFHNDDTIKYYACLAIAALVSNKEIEAAVQKSGTLELIEPFIQTHTPAEFATTSATHSHGQSINWLKRLIPVLLSQREEARNLAAFHFCMEAEIKKQQGKTDLFQEIGAIESLKKVASSPNGIASKYAAQTLRLIGEEVPHKLSQQVPTWSVEDVREWVKQIGFPQYAESFSESRVDGDLLLQLSEDMLKEDIGMKNGILRRRFIRELNNLKRVADYSSCDQTNLNNFLQSLGQEYCVYTYDMLIAGIDRDTLMSINEEQLLTECGIKNKIHRLKIQQGVKVERGEFSICDDSSIDKNLDVFISYRRSNGSQLASLLKVHLEIRNISVFLDVDRLEAGKFDNNLLQSIRSARNFILVLTPGALDRCFNDEEQRDWIHKEVACALSSQCNIIPVFDNFVMPDSEQLPESMRAVTAYNGVKWIHDYQEACVDKIDRFIRGERGESMMDRFLNSQPSTYSGGTLSTTLQPYNRQNTYQRTISNDSKANSSCSDETGQNSSGKE